MLQLLVRSESRCESGNSDVQARAAIETERVIICCLCPLQILSSHHLISAKQNAIHLLALQTPLGGVLKNDDQPHPDAMHSYLSLAALSLHSSGLTADDDGWRQRSGISPLLGTRGRLDPKLNVSEDTVQWIRSRLHGRGRIAT